MDGRGLAGVEYGQECWSVRAGNRLAMYQNSAATPPDPQACIPGRQDSFQNFGLQAISETGPLNPVQIYAATLNPNTDNTPQYTILSTCKTCPYGNSSFALQNGVAPHMASLATLGRCCPLSGNHKFSMGSSLLYHMQATVPSPAQCPQAARSLGSPSFQ